MTQGIGLGMEIRIMYDIQSVIWFTVASKILQPVR